MGDFKRFHPFIIAMNLFDLFKYSAFLIFFFILSLGIKSSLYTYGRIAFVLLFALTIFKVFADWFVQKYKIEDHSFYMYKGLFTKNEQVIPFSKIQNVQRRTSFLQRIFKLTSLTLETGISGADSAVGFKVISINEADRIEDILKQSELDNEDDQETTDNLEIPFEQVNANRIVHFIPTKKDILKASFTSFSFLLVIPIIGSIYSKLRKLDGIEEKAEGFLSGIVLSGFVLAGIAIAFIIISVIIGIIRTYLKYGKYNIASDNERIYITKGVLNQSTFSILKDKVQAIEITQSTMKRLLGLAEIKLISAGGIGEEALDTNSLYPFLPVKQAYVMIQEILPSYEITQTMERFPKKSFWIRMLKPYWFWLIATGVLFYFKPTVVVEQAWWILSIGLFVLIVMLRVLDYLNMRYIINDKFIQFKTGSLQTSVFISKRDKIVEVQVTRSKMQQWLGLASIGTINRAKPVHHTGVDDIPVEMATTFYKWYAGRMNDIETE